ncbi:MAG: hypothetical protein ACLFRI_06485 [Candidatus Izemoplasmataceae bacterium]
MASQFRNSNLGYYLYSAVVILIGAASIFVFWFMIAGFNLGRYPENTFIGSVYIGGLTEDEAEEKLRNRIEDWLNDERVVFEVNYQGYEYELDRELLFYDISRSMNNIEPGQTNVLFVSFDDSVRSQILFELEQQAFMSGLQDQFDLETLLDDFISDGARMRTFSSKNLNRYILIEDNLYDIIYETNVETPSSVSASTLNDKLLTLYPSGELTIDSRSSFSVLEAFDETFTNDELSFLSTVLIDVVSHSHMTLFEYNYLPQVPNEFTIDNYPYFGRNVLVHRSQGLDFSFENNALESFTIEFEQSGDFITARLIGAPLLNEITVDRNYTYIDYPTQTTQNPSLTQPGVRGVIVEVTRTMHNLEGEIISQETIITEYYAPIAEIILA